MDHSHLKFFGARALGIRSITGFLTLIWASTAGAQGLTTGSIQIVPNTANTSYVASATEWVTMGVPFASCTVTGANRNDQFKLLDDTGAEVSIFVKETLTWPTRQPCGVESTRALKVQFQFDATGGAKTYTWNLTGRNTAGDALEAAVSEIATDLTIKGPLMEPRVFAIHDDDYLVQSELVPPTVGLTTELYDTQYYREKWELQGRDLNFTTSTRGNWLFDRTSTLYRQAMRRAEVAHYREAYLTHEFVIERIDDGTVPDPAESSGDACVGCFAFGGAAGDNVTNGDPKYIYTENIRLHLALTGDDSWTPDANTYANTREEMWKQMAQILINGDTRTPWLLGIVEKDGFIEPYDLADLDGPYTERKAGIGLTTVLNACQLLNDPTVCGWTDTIIDNMYLHQTANPDGLGNLGYLGHSWAKHEGEGAAWVGILSVNNGTTVRVEDAFGDVGKLTTGDTLRVNNNNFLVNDYILAADATDLGGGVWEIMLATPVVGTVGTRVWTKELDVISDRAFSIWMSAQIADGVWQYYNWTQDATRKAKAKDLLYGLGVAIAKYGMLELDRGGVVNPTNAKIEAAFSTPGEQLDFYRITNPTEVIYETGCSMTRAPFPMYASSNLVNTQNSGVSDKYLKRYINASSDFSDQHVPDIIFMLALSLHFETDRVKRAALNALIEDSFEWYERWSCTARLGPPRAISWQNKTDPFGTYKWVSAFAIEYSGTTFNEDPATNNGTIQNTLTLTVGGGVKFANKAFVSPGDFEVTNLPANLTATLTRTSDTTATLALTGAATNNFPVNNVSNLTVEIKDGALDGFEATRLENTLKTDLAIEFVNPLLTYSGTQFSEAASNDGAISTSITIDLTGDTFVTSSGAFAGGLYAVTGLPTGLAASLNATSATQAVLTLTGTANTHGNGASTGGIAFEFKDGAFTTTATASNTTNYNNTFSIDFYEPGLAYSAATFTENVATNNGAINNSLIVTLTDDTFVVPGGAMTENTHFTVANVPATLSVVVTGTSATTATVALSGTADNHASVNNVSDLTLNFLPAAFTTTTNVTNLTNATKADIAINFADGALNYSTSSFIEAGANDGSITTVATLTLIEDTFVVDAAEMTDATHYTIANVPAGLTAVITGTSATTATVALTGNADAHADGNDVNNLTISFLDAAFTSGNAASVTGAVRNDLVIDFTAPAPPPPAPGGGGGGGGGGSSPIFGDTTGAVVQPGSTVSNFGNLIDLNNSGTVTGGRISGNVMNQVTGILQDVTMSPGTVVTGGRLTGQLKGEGMVKNALLDITSIDSGVKIGAGTKLTRASVQAVNGLDLTGAIRTDNGELNLNHPLFVDTDGSEQSVLDLALRSVNALFTNPNSVVDDSDGDGTATIVNSDLGNATVFVTPTGVETTSDGDGVSFNERGELTIVNSGIKTTFAPSPADAEAFAAALAAVGANSEIQPNGRVQVTFNGGRLALNFSYAATQDPASLLALSTGETTFSELGSSSDPATYRIVVNFPGGMSQVLIPALNEIETFSSWVTSSGYTLNIDGVSGIVTVRDGDSVVLRGIPDYALRDGITAPGVVEMNPTIDINGDGHYDFYFDTNDSRQVIFGVPE